jgi:hypothetical protein
MQKHTKINMNFFGYTTGDFIECELSGTIATEIHHIGCRGMGGSKEKDYIENLMAINRENHNKYGDKKAFMVFLYVKHLRFVKEKRPDYVIKFDKIDLMYRNSVIALLNHQIND